MVSILWQIPRRGQGLDTASKSKSVLGLFSKCNKLRETFTYFHQFILKAMINNAHEQPDEEVEGEVHGMGHSFLGLSGSATLPQSPRVHQPMSSPNPGPLALYGGFMTQT